MLRNGNGRYTPEHVSRCADVSGAFGGQLDKLFTIAGKWNYTHTHIYIYIYILTRKVLYYIANPQWHDAVSSILSHHDVADALASNRRR